MPDEVSQLLGTIPVPARGGKADSIGRGEILAGRRYGDSDQMANASKLPVTAPCSGAVEDSVSGVKADPHRHPGDGDRAGSIAGAVFHPKRRKPLE